MTFWINLLIQNFIIFFPFKTWGNFGLVKWQFSFYLLTEKTYSEVYHPVLTYLLTWVLFHWQHAIWYSNIYKRLKLVAVCLCLKGCENLISLGKHIGGKRGSRIGTVKLVELETFIFKWRKMCGVKWDIWRPHGTRVLELRALLQTQCHFGSHHHHKRHTVHREKVFFSTFFHFQLSVDIQRCIVT